MSFRESNLSAVFGDDLLNKNNEVSRTAEVLAEKTRIAILFADSSLNDCRNFVSKALGTVFPP